MKQQTVDNNKMPDANVKIVFIVVLFIIILFFVFLVPPPKTLPISTLTNESWKGGNTAGAGFSGNSVSVMNNASVFNYSPSNASTGLQNMPNITCTPYRLEDTLFIERAYTNKIQDKEIDTTVFTAQASNDGYAVKSTSSINYKGQNLETQMVWYFDRNMKCKRMDMVTPMSKGTQSTDKCYGYPPGVLCVEMLNGTGYVSSRKYKVSGVDYDIDVYNFSGIEIGVGKEVPLIFYEKIPNNNISIELYYIKRVGNI